MSEVPEGNAHSRTGIEFYFKLLQTEIICMKIGICIPGLKYPRGKLHQYIQMAWSFHPKETELRFSITWFGMGVAVSWGVVLFVPKGGWILQYGFLQKIPSLQKLHLHLPA